MKPLSVLFLLFLSVAVCFAEEQDEADVPVRFAIHWQPQAQFSGVFVAVKKGYFQKNLPNKKVEIVYPRTSEKQIENVGSGKIEFCGCWFPDALDYRILNPDKKVVLVSQVTQTTPIMLVSHKSSGIKSPKDLNGKKVQLWRGNDVMLRHFFQVSGASPIQIPQGGSMVPFLYRCVDAACAMYYNEYHTLLEHGLTPDDLQTFRLNDFGYDFPGDGIYCLEKTYQEQPEVCKGIAAAIQEGWSYACKEENEAEVLEIMGKYIKEANVLSSKSHQRWMLRTFKLDLTVPYGGAADNGSDVLDKDDFERILNLLKESENVTGKKITSFPNYAEFYPAGKK